MIYSLRTNPNTFGAAQSSFRLIFSSTSHTPHPRPFLAVTSRLGHIRTFLSASQPSRGTRHQDKALASFFGPSRRLLSEVSQGAVLINKRRHLGRPQEYSTAAGVATLPSINETMSSNTPPPLAPPTMKTQIIKVSQGDSSSTSPFGQWSSPPQEPSPLNNLKNSHLNTWLVPPIDHSNLATLVPLQQAAAYLRQSDIPVAFPTETVYGLGADATRSAAVRGIYKAKGRPSDNPLIVHVCDLDMLRDLLSPSPDGSEPIPEIYHPLIAKFWPGPLTILLPNPSASSTAAASPSPRPKLALAPEVTATLPTFGARMPSSPLARSLIKLANRPLAAPSANASTKPSPTTAQHVLDDLDRRIELILDGGSCSVGVESTVVDGLCNPPVVLRPGGVSIEELRRIPGWEGVEKAYKDYAEHGTGVNGEKKEAAPRAPGMKYKHYSPRAKVVLYEAGLVEARGKENGKGDVLREEDLEMVAGLEKKDGKEKTTVAVIRTTGWPVTAGLGTDTAKFTSQSESTSDIPFTVTEGEVVLNQKEGEQQRAIKLLDVDLGKDVRGVAHGLFAALRELDRRGADIIFVEGVREGDGQDIAAAVMNRLRKAASVIRS